MSSGRREVSELEAAFFREVLNDARPLKHKSARSQPPKPAPRFSKTEPHVDRAPQSKAPLYADTRAPDIGGHRGVHLRKGRLEPEAKLDLHGYRQESAYRALQRFLMRAQGSGRRVVLVVTGKGGTLRDMLPRWLGEPEFRTLVVGICSAHAKHGGAGAFYVALKKQRQN
jgi:DNA-nicking Smr family endonuclease